MQGVSARLEQYSDHGELGILDEPKDRFVSRSVPDEFES